MKKFISILSATILIISCTTSKVETLIEAYIQQIDENVKLDLSFKPNKTDFIGAITGQDSLNFYFELFKEKASDQCKISKTF